MIECVEWVGRCTSGRPDPDGQQDTNLHFRQVHDSIFFPDDCQDLHTGHAIHALAINGHRPTLPFASGFLPDVIQIYEVKL